MDKKCGFDDRKDCTEKCRYYETCARNPHREKKVRDAKQKEIT